VGKTVFIQQVCDRIGTASWPVRPITGAVPGNKEEQK
jgi:hypothetical protein